MLILASASPRRRQLLSQLRLPFTVMPAAIAEQPAAGEDPAAYVVRMAQAKARHVTHQFPQALVLGADTAVGLDGQVLGKPRDGAEARQMLRRLSGREHTVMTSLALLRQCPQLVLLDTVRTQVRFRTLQQDEIERYIATGEPFDKAGAYAIQGGAAAFVAAVEGCYTNVVGLPLRRTAALLRAAGVEVSTAPAHNAKTAW